MNLVVFDVDGTLTETTRVDTDCFVRALDRVFGFKEVDTDWSVYKHVTDSGVLHEIHESRVGRGPLVSEVARFREHFVTLLTQAWHESPFAGVPGAAECLEVLSESEEYRVALATGGWRDSARLKMASAGMCYDNYPSASADDSIERETIIKLSIERAAQRHGQFDGIVYVGDGVWDARACRNLGLPFIGIGAIEQAKRLRGEGATCVLPNFGDRELFLRHLAKVTRLPSLQREALP
jgi:phosphoglycolate phosphatase-like HAD superfamily hydrolase